MHGPNFKHVKARKHSVSPGNETRRFYAFGKDALVYLTFKKITKKNVENIRKVSTTKEKLRRVSDRSNPVRKS